MLRVQNIHFAYRDKPILQDFNLEVADGELLGLVGPNGAGKTTLMKLISGVRRPSKGQIRVNGIDVGTLNVGKRATLVSSVPQNPQLPLSLRVLDLVLMGRNPHLKLLQWEGHHDLEISRQAMEMTDTWHLANRVIGTLSGGEQQRAVVAMALAQEAPLMLMDEPTSNLDLAHQISIMDLVRAVQRQRGGAVLVAMHDLTLAAQYCDQLVLVSGGHSYAAGPPSVVLTTENISRVYGADVFILSHPQTGTPVVVSASSPQV